MKKVLLLAAALLMLQVDTASAWGRTGHDAIAYIAECHLTPRARRVIERYLGHSIVYDASWMDDWRSEPQYAWGRTIHSASVDDQFEYMPDKRGDVVSGLERSIETLADYRTQDDSTVVACLRCIIHFMGDLHCPGHVRYGGGKLKSYPVYFNGRKYNYHTVWDDVILESCHRWSYLEYGHQLDAARGVRFAPSAAARCATGSARMPSQAVTSTSRRPPGRSSPRGRSNRSSTATTRWPSSSCSGPATGWPTCSTSSSGSPGGKATDREAISSGTNGPGANGPGTNGPGNNGPETTNRGTTGRETTNRDVHQTANRPLLCRSGRFVCCSGSSSGRRVRGGCGYGRSRAGARRRMRGPGGCRVPDKTTGETAGKMPRKMPHKVSHGVSRRS